MLFTSKRRSLGLVAMGVSVSMMTAGCGTTNVPEVRAPSLNFAAKPDQCTSSLDFSNPVRLADDEKIQKRAMKSQRIYLGADMGAEDIRCTYTSAEKALPYVSFKLPTGMTGRVVSAGSKLDTAVIFAADVSTYDEAGERVRRFQRDDYRRLGQIYGVQFSPRENEAFVVIQADPTLVGEMDSTVETSTYAQNITVAYGAAVSSGTNTVGVQNTFDRTYSFNGEVAVITVFPKQEKPKS